MQHFAASKNLVEAFKFRSLTRHAGKRSVSVSACGDHQVAFVFDTKVSREMLTSKAFVGFNYFESAMAPAIAAGERFHFIESFYNSTLLFKEGAEHHELKRSFHRTLETLCEELRAAQPSILAYFRKRSGRIVSAFDFSNALVRICAGLLIARLTAIPMKRVLRALALRRNVFFYFYHPSRQRATNDALSHLYGRSPPAEPGTSEWAEHLLAQSLIVMGIDPMVGSICASVVDGQDERFAAGASRYSATSFVSRICTHPTAIAGTEYRPGDVCYIALVPAEDEVAKTYAGSSSSLAFGIGVHACIGKHLSLVVLEIAEAVFRDAFSQGFAEPTEIAPDGAFLAFRRI